MSQLLAGFEPVVVELKAAAGGYFAADDVSIEPGRRVDGPYSSVLRVRTVAGGVASYAFIKVLKPRDTSTDELARIGRLLEREYRSTLAFHRDVASDPEIGAVRPIAYFPHLHALVTEEVPGEPLSDLLDRVVTPSPDVLAVARRVGRWVRAYEQTSGGGGVVELAERRAYLDDRLRPLEGAILSPAERAAVLARFDALAGAIGSGRVAAVPIHADLTPANIIVSAGGRVTVLDFTMAKTGAPAHDLSHVYFHLALRSARRPARRAAYGAIQDAVLNGYDPVLAPSAPLFQLMLWQHAVCHVAMLAERRKPLLGPAYRWFIRRRWRTCAAIPALQAGPTGVAAAWTPAGAG